MAGGSSDREVRVGVAQPSFIPSNSFRERRPGDNSGENKNERGEAGEEEMKKNSVTHFPLGNLV
ncbi:hypothetical protein HPP92_010808 [Vanilla planifolia]|uniref:Uncharacterized protein n=1 Tax=Vanilla planifolia TaxID=51239 RepID=A0A835V172_VANPL|nr:hypothetical protein HPP92_010808 [Vanilla planifolia]